MNNKKLTIRITDISNYDPDMCNNGGKYSFTTRYEEQKDGKFEVCYSTSSEIRLCPVCGQGNSWDKLECDCGDAPLELVGAVTVLYEMLYANHNPNYIIEIERGVFN